MRLSVIFDCFLSIRAWLDGRVISTDMDEKLGSIMYEECLMDMEPVMIEDTLHNDN